MVSSYLDAMEFAFFSVIHVAFPLDMIVKVFFHLYYALHLHCNICGLKVCLSGASWKGASVLKHCLSVVCLLAASVSVYHDVCT